MEAQTAQAIGVPMVALSQARKPTEAGDLVFRGFLPLEQQVDAPSSMQWSSRAGRPSRSCIPRARTERAHVTSSPPRWSAGRLDRAGRATPRTPPTSSRLHANSARRTTRRARCRVVQDAQASRARGRKDIDKLVLPPTVDFDAIFIPDNWRRGALVASSSRMRSFRSVDSGRTATQNAFAAGPERLNNPRIVEAGAQYMQKAIFVDAFAGIQRREHAVIRGRLQAGARSEPRRDRRRDLGRDPSAHGAVVAEAPTGPPSDRNSLQPDRRPVAGGDRFRDDREVARDLVILTVAKDRIREGTTSGISDAGRTDKSLTPAAFQWLDTRARPPTMTGRGTTLEDFPTRWTTLVNRASSRRC